MKQALLLPLHLVAVFTWAKSFRNNPVIGSLLMNRLGLHVARVVVAHLLFRFRLLLLSPLVPREDRQQFLRNGFLLKTNFLPEQQFAALREEASNCRGEIREIIEGDTETQRLFLTHVARNSLPQCRAFVAHPPLDRLLRYTSSKNRPPFFFVELLRQHAREGSPDPQKDFHRDTFHPCVKAWLYLDDVDQDNGPFVYVPGSHRLSWARLKWEYRESLRASIDKQSGDARYWDGSFRVSAEDRSAMGLGEPISFHVPRNSLIIANVWGFHRRGEAEGRNSRMTIWMQARDNPFNPLFTPFPKATARLFEVIWDRHLKKVDRQLAGSGIQRSYQGQFERS